MNIKISVLIPTRKRPVQLMHMLDSLYTNASNKTALETILYIDDDDITTEKLTFPYPNIKKIIGPRNNMGVLNTACLKQATGDIIMLCNDDVIVRTADWDKKIYQYAQRFPDEIYLLYPNDMHQREALSTFPILSAKTCVLIGDVYPKEYRGALIDFHLVDIFKRLLGIGHNRMVYMDDVIFEHMHHIIGKSEYDATYKDRQRFADDVNFIALTPVRRNTAELLSSAIQKLQTHTHDNNSIKAYHSIRQFAKDALFYSQAPLSWRLKLLARIILRKLYYGLLNILHSIPKPPQGAK